MIIPVLMHQIFFFSSFSFFWFGCLLSREILPITQICIPAYLVAAPIIPFLFLVVIRVLTITTPAILQISVILYIVICTIYRQINVLRLTWLPIMAMIRIIPLALVAVRMCCYLPIYPI